MMPSVFPTMYQSNPAPTRDLMDFLYGLALTPEEFARGIEYLTSASPQKVLTTCTVDGCLGIEYARGLCRSHYDQMRWYGEVPPPKVAKTCTTDGCETKAICRGTCQSHYNKMMYAARTAKQ